MISLTEEYIKSVSFNDKSFTNAKKLANGGKLSSLHITKEEDLIFGECAGSGKDNYIVSVDFKDPLQPVFRCSCPSRQIPCKHSTALLCQYFLKKNDFTEEEIPEDVVRKREKIGKQAERKETKQAEPKKETKVSLSAQTKKFKIQMEGLKLIENFITECLCTGFSGLPQNQLIQYRKTLLKEMESYYIPEFIARAEEIISTLELAKKAQEPYLSYKKAGEQISSLMNLTKKSKDCLSRYVEEKKQIEPEDAALFSLMGYTWKLTELSKLGFTCPNVSLVQLGIYTKEDSIRRQFTDIAYYIAINGEQENVGRIYQMETIIPYHLTKRLKPDDTVTGVIETRELYIYPGEDNKRIRFGHQQVRPMTTDICKQIKKSARRNYSEIVKEVKLQKKNSLSEKNPVILIYYEQIVVKGEKPAIKSIDGEYLILQDTDDLMPKTIPFLTLLLEPEDRFRNAVAGMVFKEADSGNWCVKPISIVTDTKVIRFLG